MTKNPKLQLCKQHFPLEALSIHQPPNIVPPKGMRRHRLQFWIFNLMLNQSNEQTMTAKRSLLVSDPSQSDRDPSQFKYNFHFPITIIQSGQTNQQTNTQQSSFHNIDICFCVKSDRKIREQYRC